MAGIIIELIVVVLAFCTALYSGALAPYIVFPAYLLVLSLKVTPVGRRLKVSRLFLVSMALGLATTLYFAVVTYGWLTDLHRDNPENFFSQFFLAPPVLRLLWSTALGLFVAFDLLAVVWILLASFSAQGKYGDFEIFRNHKRTAIRTTLFGMLGLSQGRINVREGAAQSESGSSGGLMLFGGPGELMVQEGHAVILERNGRVSRVVASGPTFLEPFERLSMVVPLQTRAERIFVEQLVTSEGLMIDQLEIWVFHTVALGSVEERTQDGQFQYNESILRTSVWSPSGNDWRETVRGITTRMAHRIVPRYSLREIMRPENNTTETGAQDLGPDSEEEQGTPASTTDAQNAQPVDPRQQLITELRAAVSQITVRIGVAIRGLDLGAVRVSPNVRAHLEEAPLALMALEAAEQNAEAMQLVERARAKAQRAMIQAIREAWVGAGDPTDKAIKDQVIAVRYIEALEKMATDPSTKVIIPMDSRLLAGLLGSPDT
jgi:regulator of protease activity HflC (stomatin/prohibitin superfamily)